jgi:hypothetical protein
LTEIFVVAKPRVLCDEQCLDGMENSGHGSNLGR